MGGVIFRPRHQNQPEIKDNDMREIKFRALTREGNIIKDIGCIEFFDDEMIIVNGEIPVKQIMQYTGLNDKNGVEIYDGDICLIVYSSGHLKQEDTVRIEWVDEFMTFCPFTNKEWDSYKRGMNHFKYCYEGDYRGDPPQLCFLCQYESYELLVIGNIHENPDLRGDNP